jgi:hypothetical protein
MKGANALLCLPAASGTVKQYSTVTALLIGDVQPPADTTLCFFSKAAAVGTSSTSVGATTADTVGATKVSASAI